MWFLLAGVFCLLNIHYGWFPQDHGITPSGALVGAMVMLLCGVVQVQTEKIIEAISNSKEK